MVENGKKKYFDLQLPKAGRNTYSINKNGDGLFGSINLSDELLDLLNNTQKIIQYYLQSMSFILS